MEIEPEPSSGTQSPLIILVSAILYALSWLLNIIAEISIELAWTWFWRILSAVSLSLLMYINWDKAKEIYKKKSKQ